MSNKTLFNVVLLSFFFAVAWAVLFPYFRDKPDYDLRKKHRAEVKWIMRWFEQHAADSVVTFSNEEIKASLEKFDYLQPTNPIPKGKANDTIVLVERPGHYKRTDGGHVGYASGVILFLQSTQYAELLRTNKLPRNESK